MIKFQNMGLQKLVILRDLGDWNFYVPGVALKSGLPQKYAFTKKSTIFTQSL